MLRDVLTLWRRFKHLREELKHQWLEVHLVSSDHLAQIVLPTLSQWLALSL